MRSISGVTGTLLLERNDAVFECHSLVVSEAQTKLKTPKYLIISHVKPKILRRIWVNMPLNVLKM